MDEVHKAKPQVCKPGVSKSYITLTINYELYDCKGEFLFQKSWLIQVIRGFIFALV
jgi:hypothetical protein